MSDTEALMWAIERDPWLQSGAGVLTILDRPADWEQFRRRMAWAVAEVPRLRERVTQDAPPLTGRLVNPAWTTDTEFDLDHHVRRVALPGPGSLAQLHDLAVRVLADPFDRTRPLWQFVLVEGLEGPEGGRGALVWKLHHTVSDGMGALALATKFLEGTRDWPLPPEVDLDAVIAKAAADERAEQHAATAGGRDAATAAVAEAVTQVVDALRGPLGVLRAAAGEVALWGADPARVADVGGAALDALGQLRTAIGPKGQAGSPLWRTRSRHRRLEALTLPVDDVKAAAKRLGGTVNDVFVAGAVEGAVRYHAERGVALDTLNLSFIVSTRADASAGGNAFTPTPVQVPAAPAPAADRFRSVQEVLAAGRAQVKGDGLLAQLARLAKLLPASTLAALARAQAGALDFATSNLRGVPIDVYVSGARVVRNVTMGPLVGTAFNLTALSFGDRLDLGLHVDPVAVDDPAGLAASLQAAYDDLLRPPTRRAASTGARPPTPRAASTRRAPTAPRARGTTAPR